MVSRLRSAVQDLGSEKFSLHWFLFLFSALIYLNSWSNNYTYGDEVVTTEANTNVQLGIKGLQQVFDSEGQTWFDFIPLTASTFVLEHSLVGFYPPLGNLIQLLLFAISVVLVFVFLDRAFPLVSKPVKFITSLLFLVHPVHTSVVNDFGGRAELLGLIFLLLSMLQMLKWRVSKTSSHLMQLMLLAFLCLLSDPSYMVWFVLPASILAVAYRASFQKVMLVLGVYVFPLVIYGAWRFGGVADANIEAINNPLILLFETAKFLPTTVASAGIYLKQIVFPYHLCSSYGYGQITAVGWGNIEVVLSLFGYVGLALISAFFIRKKPFVAIGALILLVDVLPFTNIFFLQAELADEKVLYGGTLGFSMILGGAFQGVFRLDGRKSVSEVFRSNSAARIILGALFLVLTYAVVKRNFDWITSYSLAKVDVENSDNSARLHYLRASTAQNEYKLYPNRGLEFQMEVATTHYLKAVSIYPEWLLPRLELGYLYLDSKNQPSEAIRFFKTALAIDSTNVEAKNGIGYALAADGKTGEAITAFAKVLEQNPANKEALNQIVSLYFLEEHLEGARLFNQRFFQFHPNAFEPYVHQGNLSLAAGDTVTAVRYFDEALAKNYIGTGFVEYVNGLKSKAPLGTNMLRNSTSKSNR
jgi:hypothetical protein